MSNPNLDLAPIIPGFRRALNAFLFDLRSLCPRVEGRFKLGFSNRFQGMTLLDTIAEEFKVEEYDPFGVASRSAWIRTASCIHPIPACMSDALTEHYVKRAGQMGRMFKAYVNSKAGEETSTPIIPGFRQAMLTFLRRVDYHIPRFMIRSASPLGLTPADGAEALALLRSASAVPGFNPFGIRSYQDAAAFARTMQLYFEGKEN